MEYLRIHNEYKFIKKRSVMNYLISQRQNIEKHFHNWTINMLNNIAKFEESNLAQLKNIATTAFAETVQEITSNEGTKWKAFESALDGIRKGEMNYKNDVVLPTLISKIKEKTSKLKELSAEEEAKMLSLTANQRLVI